jgi:hypothetical protein
MAFVAASPLAEGVPGDAVGAATLEGEATWVGDAAGAADAEVEGLAEGLAEPQAANSIAAVTTAMTSTDPRGRPDG